MSTRRWSAGWLLLSWIGYWLILAFVALGHAIQVAQRITQLPDGKGNISLGFNNATLNLTMLESGKLAYAGSVRLGELALWVAGPPLLLWLLWLAQHARAREERVEGVEAARDARALGEPAPQDRARPSVQERDRIP